MIRLIILFLAVFPLFSQAAVEVIGNFKARKICPAYISKNKKTNPGDIFIQITNNYSLQAINRLSNPDWLQIIIPNTANSLRWVSADCGVFSYELKKAESCTNPGLADSNVLALSWQPGFCQTYGYEAGKPECRELKKESYQAQHLVLHGLWPNKRVCGQQYGYCGVMAKPNHCDYQPLQLSQPVANHLQKYMPSYAYGSCLERHEWNKHGSCQMLSKNDYFALALRLNREINDSAFAQFLTEKRGHLVKREQLMELLRESFGEQATQKISLGCKNGMLVDIYIHLPAEIPAQESLQTLINAAPSLESPNGCPAKLTISAFTTD